METERDVMNKHSMASCIKCWNKQGLNGQTGENQIMYALVLSECAFCKFKLIQNKELSNIFFYCFLKLFHQDSRTE